MGAFFVNYQIRADDQEKVVTAAGEIVQSRAYISPPKDGWVTVYDENSESQDAYEIGRLGSQLSARLETALFAFVISDSSMLVYYIFDNGDLLDEYHSAAPPTDLQAETDQKDRFIGRPEILMNYCPPGTDRSNLEIALQRGNGLVEGGFAESIYAEERLHPLAAALQMDDQRTAMGFNDFDRRQSTIPQGREFKKIDGKKMRRPTNSRRIPPPIPRPPK